MFWLLLALILLQVLLWVPFALHFSWQSRELQGHLHAQLRFLGLCLADYSLRVGLLPDRCESRLTVLGIGIPLGKKKPKQERAKKKKPRNAGKWPIRPRVKALEIHVRLGIAEDAAATAIIVGALRSLAGALMKNRGHADIRPDFRENILLTEAHGIFCLSLGKIGIDRIRRR